MQMTQTNCDFLRKSLPDFQPVIGMVLGSGCGRLAEAITQGQSWSYDELTGFASSRIKGHRGQLTLGYLGQLPVMCFQGRRHWYEDCDAQTMRLGIELMHAMGCQQVVLTNAVGSLEPQWLPGQLVCIEDHINFQSHNPLRGLSAIQNPDRSVFVGMDGAYDQTLRSQIMTIASQQDIALASGVYLAVDGPNFETPAEIKAFKILGADVVGMSTVSEVITARYFDMKVLTLSVVTNLAAGLSQTPLSHEQTLAGANMGITQLIELVTAYATYTAKHMRSNNSQGVN